MHHLQLLSLRAFLIYSYARRQYDDLVINFHLYSLGHKVENRLKANHRKFQRCNGAESPNYVLSLDPIVRLVIPTSSRLFMSFRVWFLGRTNCYVLGFSSRIFKANPVSAWFMPIDTLPITGDIIIVYCEMWVYLTYNADL